MYSRSISPSCARNVQDIDMVGRKPSNIPPASRDKFFDAVDHGSRRRHGAERENTKFPRKNFFNWSSLVQNGKKAVSGLSFSKSHLPKYSNSNESGGSFFRRTNTVSGDGNFYPRRELSFRFCDSPINDSSKFVSAAPSFRTSSLQGLSYVAALHSGVAQISDNDSELDQASTVVTSSSIGSKLHSGSGNSGCCSPSDVFASFSDDSEDPGSPLFDPDLLNAFERALADVDKDCLKTSENVSCDAASVSPSQVSLKPKNHEVDPKDNSENLRGGARSSRLKISIGASEGILGDCRDKKDFENARKILEGLLGSSRGRKSTACKEFFPSESANPLNTFMSLCPSDGDQKVVLFLTSLRGIRKTYEDCNNVRMLLRSSSVRIDERDVSMHSEYKRELRELLGVSVSLPRLFIKGKYIGGVEEIMRLHEDGVLEKLLEDLPKVTSFRACEACGEMRFVPCTECSGSRKIITDDNEVERCPECNENGLVRCLICC